MRKLPCAIVLLLATFIFSCKESENYWTKYEEWRKANNAFFVEQSANHEYQKIYPAWDNSAYILMKYHTKGDASVPSPYLTSTVDVKYRGTLYDGTPFDSSYTQTTYGDSISRSKISEFIEGWQIALTRMHPGDSCTIIIPQNLGYGEQLYKTIYPYSTLIFDIKLVGIPTYERPRP